MTTGQGGPQLGQFPVPEYSERQLEWNKVLTDILTRGKFGSFDASGNVIEATSAHTGNFCIIKRDRGNGDPKVPIAMPYEIGFVEVDAAKTITPGKPIVVSGAGKGADRVAEAANKIAAWGIGTYDQLDGKVVQAVVTAGNLALVYIESWKI
jgi:hypothetical protein